MHEVAHVDFYTRVLCLVKVTINFDAPDTCHLYYGDGVGHPGTFSPWPQARRGRQGSGQVGEIALALGPASLGYWANGWRSTSALHRPREAL